MILTLPYSRVEVKFWHAPTIEKKAQRHQGPSCRLLVHEHSWMSIVFSVVKLWMWCFVHMLWKKIFTEIEYYNSKFSSNILSSVGVLFVCLWLWLLKSIIIVHVFAVVTRQFIMGAADKGSNSYFYMYLQWSYGILLWQLLTRGVTHTFTCIYSGHTAFYYGSCWQGE